MLNLLRSDFYRLFKSKSYYICMGVEFALALLQIVIMYIMNKTNASPVIPMDFNGSSFGMSLITGGNIPMMLGISTAIYVTADFSHGTMKNVVSKGFSKILIYLSKLITMIAASYLFIFATMLVGTISATILSGKLGDFTGEYVGVIFKTIGIELLLYTALTSILLLFSMVVKNLGGVIAINMIYILIFEQLFYYLLQVIAKDKILFTKYGLLNNIAFYAGDTVVGADYLRSALVALITLVITIASGMFLFKNSDVK